MSLIFCSLTYEILNSTQALKNFPVLPTYIITFLQFLHILSYQTVQVLLSEGRVKIKKILIIKTKLFISNLVIKKHFKTSGSAGKNFIIKLKYQKKKKF